MDDGYEYPYDWAANGWTRVDEHNFLHVSGAKVWRTWLGWHMNSGLPTPFLLLALRHAGERSGRV